jgi:hypothetical protein
LRPKVQAGPNHPKFQSLACQTRVCEAFAPNSPRAGGDEVLDAGAHAGVSWEASIWTACLWAGEFPNCMTGTDASARDIRAASTLGCVNQCYAFSLFDIEFIVNAN